MKIFSAKIFTETNTFSPIPSGKSLWNISRNDSGSPALTPISDAVSKWRKTAEAFGWEFVESVIASAPPAGLTVRAVYEEIKDEVLSDLKEALPVDGIILALHGAMSAYAYPNCEGDLIAGIRRIVGPQIPIGVELDLHCHATRKVFENSDIVICYKEYPHTDVVERADELFALLALTMAGKIKPHTAVYDCRMMGLMPTTAEPMASYVAGMKELEKRDEVLSVSLGHGFPFGDIAEAGVKSWVITNNNPELGMELAKELGGSLFSLRAKIFTRALDIDEALNCGLKSAEFPVVMADVADNAGGGAGSDSTYILKAMIDRRIDNATIGMIYDPMLVTFAKEVGIGQALDFRLGGKLSKYSGLPLDCRATVKNIIQDATQRFPQNSGYNEEPIGDLVWLHCNGIDVVVNNYRTQVLGIEPFTLPGIDLSEKQIVVVKSSQHFYAAYKRIAGKIIYVAAPGIHSPLVENFDYQHIDKNKYPLVENPFA